tara:strand:+ start:356 stop:1789 length:1434 start_codon:yes stop_codon:yes gene_type:complete
MTLLGASGIRHVCQFIELSGLDRFIAPSYGSQHKISAQMEKAVIEFDQKEKDRLATEMTAKEITACQDETFHPAPCLVAIDPVSNFILLEEYSIGRKSSDWTIAMQKAINGLPINIIQSTSDEGKGILHHVKNSLGAHHSPDVFHVQHEIVKGTSGPLSKKTKQAEKRLEKASEDVNRLIDKKVAYDTGQPGPGRPPEFNKKIKTALLEEAKSLKALALAESHQAQVKQAIRKIGDLYHPVNPETGQLLKPEEVSSALGKCFLEIQAIATEAKLSSQCLKRIQKAKRVLPEMVSTIAFFHFSINRKLKGVSLSPAVTKIVTEKMIPSFYLSHAAEKAKTASKRHKLKMKSEEIYPHHEMDAMFSGTTQEGLASLENLAKECANIFQRSSSCVEGRNGQLSLRHHSFHHLSNRKLSALTTVHNFFIKRSDGTTAAERFFGNKPRDLFEFILANVNMPGRPAKKRRQPGAGSMLDLAAA